MDNNHQNAINNRLVTTENKICRPPLFSNNKTPTPPLSKKRSLNWGFDNKTGWEWLLLIGTLLAAFGAIAIPVAIAVGTAWFSYQQNQTSQQIAMDQQQELTLQTYLDHVSSLLLNNNLRQSKPGDNVREVARAETLTTLHSLNGNRKAIVLQFLYESGLIGASITKGEPGLFESQETDKIETIVDLSGADLSNANLSGMNLSSVDLHEANLSDADLTGTFLDGATLDGAILRHANLQDAIMVYCELYSAILEDANLDGADLQFAKLRGAIMPDGSLHH